MIITTKEQLRAAFDEAIMSCYRRDVRASLFERAKPSPEHTARMRALLAIPDASPEPPRRLRLSPRRILIIALILILTAALVGCACYLGVRLSTRETDEYLEVNGLLNLPENAVLPTTLETVYLPTNIPEGYSERVIEKSIYGIYIIYESPNGKITYTQDAADAVIRIDNEHGEINIIERNGIQYVKQASTTTNYFCWTDGEYIFGIYASKNFNDEEVFDFIDNVKTVKK